MQTTTEVYADGVQDGMEIVLRLVLGEAMHGAEPIPEPLTPEQEKWARKALDKIRPVA